MGKGIMTFLLLLAAGYGGWYTWEHYETLGLQLKEIPLPGLQKENSILTFEATYSADQLMQKNQKELLKDGNRTYGKINVKFLPFMLLEVKYAGDDRMTQEANVIWSLENGEMLLDTRNFISTHGFEDCINAKATGEDFRLMHVLQKRGGILSKEELCQELGIEAEQVFDRLETLRKKHLIAVKGDTVRIHLSSPLLKVQPETSVYHPLVSKTIHGESQIPQRYSKEQIRTVAKAAFGPDFAIRSEQTIFVPIFEINVENPDGSTLKTYWNGITGRRLELRRPIS